jgi:hypothetical protein
MPCPQDTPSKTGPHVLEERVVKFVKTEPGKEPNYAIIAFYLFQCKVPIIDIPDCQLPQVVVLVEADLRAVKTSDGNVPLREIFVKEQGKIVKVDKTPDIFPRLLVRVNPKPAQWFDNIFEFPLFKKVEPHLQVNNLSIVTVKAPRGLLFSEKYRGGFADDISMLQYTVPDDIESFGSDRSLKKCFVLYYFGISIDHPPAGSNQGNIRISIENPDHFPQRIGKNENIILKKKLYISSPRHFQTVVPVRYHSEIVIICLVDNTGVL